MANKKLLHHVHVRLRPIKAVYLVILLIIFTCTGVYALRQNNLTALRLRDKVLEVDKQNGDIESALRDLREQVYSHMNTNLSGGPNAIKPPIQLKYRYDRLVAAEKERVSKVNEKIYLDAQTSCEARFPAGRSGTNRIPCIQDYVAKSGQKEQPIEDSLYKFDFASPRFSFDVAGISLLIASVLGLTLLVRIILGVWLKKQLHDHL